MSIRGVQHTRKKSDEIQELPQLASHRANTARQSKKSPNKPAKNSQTAIPNTNTKKHSLSL